MCCTSDLRERERSIINSSALSATLKSKVKPMLLAYYWPWWCHFTDLKPLETFCWNSARFSLVFCTSAAEDNTPLGIQQSSCKRDIFGGILSLHSRSIESIGSTNYYSFLLISAILSLSPLSIKEKFYLPVKKSHLLENVFNLAKYSFSWFDFIC